MGSSAEVRQWIKPLEPTTFRPWRWPGANTRLLMGADLIVIAGINAIPSRAITAETEWFVYAGAHYDKAFAPLGAQGARWDSTFSS
jgi:hypothetical protein